MKPLFPLLSFLLLFSSLSAQKIATKKIKGNPLSYNNLILVQNGEKSFIISKYKTTNREYLCFLQWTYKVYGTNYPEVYERMLPDTNKYPEIFDPAKSNQPVKGVSKKMAQAFCQWRTDRMNEYILIREGILRKNFSQQNENNFNTETYLSSQYEGMVKNDLYDKYTKGVRKVLHSDFFLQPGFYIASKDEIKLCDSLNKINPVASSKTITSDLDWWMINLLEVSALDRDNSPFKYYKSKLTEDKLFKKYKFTSFVKKYQKDLAKEKITFDATGAIVSENDYRTFNLYNLKSKMRYYKFVSDNQKNPFIFPPRRMDDNDSLGKLNFIYIADNPDGSPICLYRTAFAESHADDITNTGFYCAMNLPYRIWWNLQEFDFINYSKRFYRY
ncbi:MAG: SUMF1/EgtB/PvdO family nonheme iron enzyme [Bacteroidota bacterium]